MKLQDLAHALTNVRRIGARCWPWRHGARPGRCCHRLGLLIAIGLAGGPAGAACGNFGSAASYPLYGSSSLAASGSVSNGSGSYTISGSGSTLNHNSGAMFTPATPPTLPGLWPSSFPANASVTDSSAASLSPGYYRNITVTGTTSFGAGDYNIASLTANDSKTLNFAAGTYNIGTLTLHDSNDIVVTSGRVRLNIGTLLLMHDKNNFNVGGSVSALQVFLYPGADLSNHQELTFTGLMYGPDSLSTFALGNKINLTGAIIGSHVALGSTSVITYSPATQTALSASSSCGPVDHYELAMPSSGLACLSSSVTITACQDASSPCSSPVSFANGQTVSLANSAGSLGASGLGFDVAGLASTTLSYPLASDGAVATVTLSPANAAPSNPTQCCPNGSGCVASSSCSTTFNTAGLIIAGAANAVAATVPAQTAGTASANYWLRAVKTGTSTQACEAALTGANSVSWAYECNNPASCSASNLLRINGGSATAVQRNNNAAAAAYLPVAMTFDANGNAPFNFTFDDVGQVRLWATKTVNSAILSGSSNAFVSKPAGLTVSNVQQTASPNLANPAASTASDARFVKAGESFSATITAVTSGGAATPNFGKEATPEGVVLSPTLVSPSGGSAGTLANPSIGGAAFSAGAATATGLSYSEVGIIRLTAALADADYLGAGAVSGSASANIGRFVPNHFTLAATPACGSFSYAGQPFTATLTARNAGGLVVYNYDGSAATTPNFAKPVTLSEPTALGLGSLSGTAVAAAAFSAGVAGASPAYGFTVKATAPQTLGLRASDSDGISSAGFTEASQALRSGRLRLSNAFGSARTALNLAVTVEYWGGAAWVLNSADNCSALAAASVVLSNPRSAAGNASAASSSAAAFSLSNGSGWLSLAAPTPAGSSLTLDIAVNLGAGATDQSCLANHPASSGAAKPWLRAQNGSCSASADRDPAARASFGIYSPESRKLIHVREIF